MPDIKIMQQLGKAAAAVVHSHSKTVNVATPEGKARAMNHMSGRGNAQAPYRFGRKLNKESK